MTARLRTFLACLGTAAILLPLGWLWWSSLLPDEYSVMDMGYADLGGGPALPGGTGHAGMSEGAMSIASLAVDPARRADVRVDLVARQETFTLTSGEEVDGYTLNGTSPGPTITARQGDLVEVRVDNANVADGIALHWHGIDVPNAMDGVAGVTQDAVLPGGRYTYRFVVDRAGTYWYHSHQMSHAQVKGGLLGPVVVLPRGGEDRAGVVDRTALVHLYDGHRTLNGSTEDLRVAAETGETVRLRVVNTDNGPMPVWLSGASYRVMAVDGTDVHGPTPVRDLAVLVTAGARVDLAVEVPEAGARVQMGERSVLLGDRAAGVPRTQAPREFVDLLTYGEPAEIGFDPADATRSFEYVIDRRPAFLDGKPGLWWTVNGHLFPDVPMYTVTQGDVVVMRVQNSSGEVHPMHLHGHHAVVLSRDGVAASGSPWWVDSLNVRDGEEYEIAFLADNPGIWMDHCHNLPHAAEGLVAHLMYAGFATPFEIGGTALNEPE